MKTSRFRHSYRENASALHRRVGDALRNSEIFKNWQIYQEYPVCRVANDYPFGSQHFDWVIPGLKIVIECHGKQHYEPVAFGGDHEVADQAFRDGQIRDRQKKASALAAGFTYVEIPYTDENLIDEQYIYDMIIKAGGICLVEEDVQKDEHYGKQQEIKSELLRRAKKRRQEHLESEKHREELDKAREYRRHRYRELKERKERDDGR